MTTIHDIVGPELGRRFEDPAPWRQRQWRGEPSPALVLHLEDISGIPFVSGILGVEEYQHRARVRARDGELFVSSTPPAPGYERYCREHLGLGRVECIQAEPLEDPTQVAAAA